MAVQPTGTITLLFTDLEGSTKLWEQHPTAMRAALKRHDDLLREAIVSHRGYVFKTIGDAFCAAFATPDDAVAAAAMAQRVLAHEPWKETGPLRARMALHTGEPEVRGGDYFGQPVNRVARLLSIGHGGQVLVSDTTRRLIEHRLPPGLKLRSRGKHRMKDLNRPQPVSQLVSTEWPINMTPLKSLPSPISGAVAALGSAAVTVGSYRIGTRSPSEGIGIGLLSPMSLYTGAKGIVLDLSAQNEYLLLGAGLLLLLLAVAIAMARRRALTREERLEAPEGGRVFDWVVNQRTFTFVGVLALVLLGAYAYQQYLWRVALPIPDDAMGFAITREASAATFEDQLADTLFTQGQASDVVVRELPVAFNASDTARARELGSRIGAEAVIIYRVDEAPEDTSETYVAYVVFTDPSVGLMLGAPATASGTASASGPAVRVKEGVAVPVLKTATLSELVNAAAGIINYNNHRLREAINHLQLAVPPQAYAANTGIVQFYLGNAHKLDGDPAAAAAALEAAAGFYEGRMATGEVIGPQDELILLKTYTERGEIAALAGDWDTALAWYGKGTALREDLVARAPGLERPSEVPATYARLYTSMADVYRAQEQPEDQAFWQRRATEELDALAANAPPNDAYPLVQEGAARFFLGDCVAAAGAFSEAIAVDPANLDARVNAGIVALLQDRPEQALAHWQGVLDADPTNVTARTLIANLLVQRALGGGYVEEADLVAAERYYREVIARDPANLAAYNELADLAQIRAQSVLLDSTALAAGDDLSVQKSQVAWPLDPARQQEALDAHADVIDSRRIAALELSPGDPVSQAGVAAAYAERQGLVFTILLNQSLAPAPTATPGATPLATATLGEQLVADGAETREWAGKVLANPDAPRLAVLQARAARVGALQREWSWYAFFAPDETRAAGAEQAFREAVAEDVAYGEQLDPVPVDEIAPLREIYFAASFLASVLDQDDAAASAYQATIMDISMREVQDRQTSTTHLSTFCREVQETASGDAARDAGDPETALTHYAAALEVNPAYVPAMLGAARAHFVAGAVDGALASARAATEVAPDDIDAWAALGFYRLAAGDVDGAGEAYDRFLERLAAAGPQRRMSAMGDALDQVARFVDTQPDAAPDVMRVLPRFADALDGMGEAAGRTYQYPALYARLGGIALRAGSPDEGETLFRRALALDPHQPAVYANLVAAVAAQGDDPAAAIAAAIAESQDPLWAGTVDLDQERVLELMAEEATALQQVLPEQAEALETFRDTIAAAGD